MWCGGGGLIFGLVFQAANIMMDGIDGMRDSSGTGKSTAWCFKHRTECWAYPEAPAGSRTGAIAGLICCEWSSMGPQWGWLSKDTIVFLEWVNERLRILEDFILAECVPNFDDAMLQELLMLQYHSMTTFVLDPTHFGVPVTRRRKYMVLLRRDRLDWHPAVKASPEAEFERFFRVPTTLPGSVFWSAPATVVERALVSLAKRQGLPARRRRCCLEI